MSEKIVINNVGNITVDINVNSVLRTNALAIALEIIKTSAASGTNINNVEKALEDLGAWTDYIHKEMTKSVEADKQARDRIL